MKFFIKLLNKWMVIYIHMYIYMYIYKSSKFKILVAWLREHGLWYYLDVDPNLGFTLINYVF